MGMRSVRAQGKSDPLPAGLPAHEISGQVWSQLVRASLDRHHEWRTPVLASTGLDGIAQARTVVLRQVDSAASHLFFYTDRRSPKVLELSAVPAAMLVFWSRRLSWQLRVRVKIDIAQDGPLVASAWSAVAQSPSAGDYLSGMAPGDRLPEAADIPEVPGGPGRLQPAEPQGIPTVSAPGNLPSSPHHLAVMRAAVQSIDWLELSRAGHRRALLTDGTVQWLVP